MWDSNFQSFTIRPYSDRAKAKAKAKKDTKKQAGKIKENVTNIKENVHFRFQFFLGMNVPIDLSVCMLN